MQPSNDSFQRWFLKLCSLSASQGSGEEVVAEEKREEGKRKGTRVEAGKAGGILL